MYEFIIIVPYRDRLEHLRAFVPHMEKFLAGQTFKIAVIEQEAGKPFNRGKLINCGFMLCDGESDTLIIHDVDSLPRGTNYYRKVTRPTHMAGRISKLGYRFPYPQFLGCVVAMPCDAFKRVNGFSNEYWGWGREDFEFGVRIRQAGLPMEHVSGEYESLPHEQSGWGPLVLARWRAFESGHYLWQMEGLNTVDFKLLSQQSLRDFLDLDVGQQHMLYKVDLRFEQSNTFKEVKEGTLHVPASEKPTLEYEGSMFPEDTPDYQTGGDQFPEETPGYKFE